MDYIVLQEEEKRSVFYENCIPISVEKTMHLHSGLRHAHEFAQISCVVSGSAEISIGGFTTQLQEGSVYVVTNFMPHAYTNVHNLLQYHLNFFSSDLVNVAGTLKDLPGFRQLFLFPTMQGTDGNISSVVQLGYEVHQEVMRVYDNMLQEVRQPRPGSDTLIQSNFMILASLLSIHAEGGTSNADSKDTVFSSVQRYIKDNFTASLSVDQIAKYCGISPSSLRKLFQEKLNKSPVEYITELRMEQSKFLLRTSDYNISQVANICGYGDSNYFTRKFHQTIGQTPKQYRSLNRTQANYTDITELIKGAKVTSGNQFGIDIE